MALWYSLLAFPLLLQFHSTNCFPFHPCQRLQWGGWDKQWCRHDGWKQQWHQCGRWGWEASPWPQPQGISSSGGQWVRGSAAEPRKQEEVCAGPHDCLLLILQAPGSAGQDSGQLWYCTGFKVQWYGQYYLGFVSLLYLSQSLSLLQLLAFPPLCCVVFYA